MEKHNALDVGGSSGSLKGSFYEKHFALILKNLGYTILKNSTNHDGGLNEKTVILVDGGNRNGRRLNVHKGILSKNETDVHLFCMIRFTNS